MGVWKLKRQGRRWMERMDGGAEIGRAGVWWMLTGTGKQKGVTEDDKVERQRRGSVNKMWYL